MPRLIQCWTGLSSVKWNRQDEVGRVTGRREDAATFARLVHRTLVAVLQRTSGQEEAAECLAAEVSTEMYLCISRGGKTKSAVHKNVSLYF